MGTSNNSIPPVGFIPRGLLRHLNENPCRNLRPLADGVVQYFLSRQLAGPYFIRAAYGQNQFLEVPLCHLNGRMIGQFHMGVKCGIALFLWQISCCPLNQIPIAC